MCTCSLKALNINLNVNEHKKSYMLIVWAVSVVGIVVS